MDEAKLGVATDEWDTFMALASSAASIFLSPHHRSALIAVVSDLKPELCTGLAVEDDGEMGEMSPMRLARRKVESAGFETVDAIAAIVKADGDADRALELLVGGWKPPAAPAARNIGGAAADAPRCPFSGATAEAGGARACPFTARAAAASSEPGVRDPAAGALPIALAQAVWLMSDRSGMGPNGIAAALGLDVALVQATLTPMSVDGAAAVTPLPEPLASAARAMADRGVSHDQIAQMLAVPCAAVTATVGASGKGDDGLMEQGKAAGRLMDSVLQDRLDELLEEDADLCCPVTLVLLVEPVKAGDGYVYERSAVNEFTSEDGVFNSPMTQTLSRAAVIEPAHDVRERATRFRIERCEALATLVGDASREPVLPVSVAMAAVDRLREYLVSCVQTPSPLHRHMLCVHGHGTWIWAHAQGVCRR